MPTRKYTVVQYYAVSTVVDAADDYEAKERVLQMPLLFVHANEPFTATYADHLDIEVYLEDEE